MKKLVIIGYGMVAHRFLEALAERDSDEWQVTVLAVD